MQAFVAGYSAPGDNVALLERLFSTRAEMAELAGAPSYAHHVLEGATLAGSPAAVEDFLLGLAAAIRPKVLAAAILHMPQYSYAWMCLSWRIVTPSLRGGSLELCNDDG